MLHWQLFVRMFVCVWKTHCWQLKFGVVFTEAYNGDDTNNLVSKDCPLIIFNEKYFICTRWCIAVQQIIAFCLTKVEIESRFTWLILDMLFPATMATLGEYRETDVCRTVRTKLSEWVDVLNFWLHIGTAAAVMTVVCTHRVSDLTVTTLTSCDLCKYVWRLCSSLVYVWKTRWSCR